MGALRGRRAAVVVVVAVGWGAAGAVAPPARATTLPDPQPWQRAVISPIEPGADGSRYEMLADCDWSNLRPVDVGTATGVPTIGLLGDSVDNQLRQPLLADPAFRWEIGTHCGENYASSRDFGRMQEVLDLHPDVMVTGYGSNNVSYLWTPAEDLYWTFEQALEDYLDRSDGIRCRVIFNAPDRPFVRATPEQLPVWHDLITRMNTRLASIDRVAHPNVFVVDWNLVTAFFPGLLIDDQHLTHLGINTRVNLALATARRCWPPDAPPRPVAAVHHGAASVWWDPLPAQEGVTSYRVTSSWGASMAVDGSMTSLSFPGVPDGVPVTFTVTATNLGGTSDPSPASAPVVASPLGSRFHPRSPVRVLDTRDGTGGRSTPLGPAQSFTLPAPTAAGVPTDARAYVLNVTATDQTAESFVSVWAAGEPRPLVSNLNPRPGIAAIPGMVTVPAGAGGAVSFYNNSGSVDLIADLVGWYDDPSLASGALFQAQTPTRVVDTRDGTGGHAGPVGPGETARFDLSGAVAAGTSAVVVNVTGVNATAVGFLTLAPGGVPRPLASQLNPQPGRVRANLTVVALGAGATLDVFNNAGTTDVVVDLVGTFGPAGATSGGSTYFETSPVRVVDTRDGTGGATGPVPSTSTLTVTLAGTAAVPLGAGAVAVDANVTVIAPSAAGHTTVWPSGPDPGTSTVNYTAFEATPNRAIVTLAGAAAAIHSTAPSIHYAIDVSGWFGPPL